MNLNVLGDVNWLAIVVATLVYFALGALWYTFLFSKPWIRAMGVDPNADGRGNPAMYAFPLVTCLIATIAVAMLAYATGTDTVAEGIVLGLVVGIGMAAAAVLVTGFFDPRSTAPMTVAGINAGYHLVGLVLASVIIAAWA